MMKYSIYKYLLGSYEAAEQRRLKDWILSGSSWSVMERAVLEAIGDWFLALLLRIMLAVHVPSWLSLLLSGIADVAIEEDARTLVKSVYKDSTILQWWWLYIGFSLELLELSQLLLLPPIILLLLVATMLAVHFAGFILDPFSAMETSCMRSIRVDEPPLFFCAANISFLNESTSERALSSCSSVVLRELPTTSLFPSGYLIADDDALISVRVAKRFSDLEIHVRISYLSQNLLSPSEDILLFFSTNRRGVPTVLMSLKHTHATLPKPTWLRRKWWNIWSNISKVWKLWESYSRSSLKFWIGQITYDSS